MNNGLTNDQLEDLATQCVNVLFIEADLLENSEQGVEPTIIAWCSQCDWRRELGNPSDWQSVRDVQDDHDRGVSA